VQCSGCVSTLQRNLLSPCSLKKETVPLKCCYPSNKPHCVTTRRSQTHVPSLDLPTGRGKSTKFDQNIDSPCTLMFFISSLNKNIKHHTETLSHQVSTQSLLQLSILIPVDRSFSPVLYQPSRHNCFHLVIIHIL